MSDDQDRLEKLLHERLRALPDLQAPRELIPGVLQRIAAQETRRWPNRPWLEWPRLAQVTSAVCLLLSAVGACYWRDNLLALAHKALGLLPSLPPWARDAWTAVQTLAGVGGRLLAATNFLYLAILAALIVALYLGVIGVGATLYRVAIAENGTHK